MIAEAIISLLYNDAAVNAVVGKRIRPNIIKPGDALPAIYVMDYRMEKMNCDRTTTYTGVIEIGVHGKEYVQANEGIKAIRKILDDFSGVVGLVGISIMSGELAPDGYDEWTESHVKIIEYQAYAKIKS